MLLLLVAISIAMLTLCISIFRKVIYTMAEMVALAIVIAPAPFAQSQASNPRSSLTHLLNEVVHVSGVIGLLPQDIGTGSDPLEEELSLLPLARLNALLDHVVAVSVLHHLVQRSIHCRLLRVQIVLLLVDTALHYFVYYLLSVFVATIFETFFDDIAGKFVVAESDDVAFDALYDAVLVLLILSVLQNVLNHIVPELVISQVIDFR